MATTRGDSRPLSPHLQVWRWHVTMATSILHRASGVALYGAAIGLAGWLTALAAGPEIFAYATLILQSIPGQLALYAVCVGISYHLANGVRHLVWDVGHGFTPKRADASGWAVMIFALLAPIGAFGLAGL